MDFQYECEPYWSQIGALNVDSVRTGKLLSLRDGDESVVRAV